MKALKSLLDKLNANTWAYWFIGVSIVLYISQSIHNGQPINDILFAQHAKVAGVIEVAAFVFTVGLIVYKWFEKRKNTKAPE